MLPSEIRRDRRIRKEGRLRLRPPWRGRGPAGTSKITGWRCAKSPKLGSNERLYLTGGLLKALRYFRCGQPLEECEMKGGCVITVPGARVGLGPAIAPARAQTSYSLLPCQHDHPSVKALARGIVGANLPFDLGESFTKQFRGCDFILQHQSEERIDGLPKLVVERSESAFVSCLQVLQQYAISLALLGWETMCRRRAHSSRQDRTPVRVIAIGLASADELRRTPNRRRQLRASIGLEYPPRLQVAFRLISTARSAS